MSIKEARAWKFFSSTKLAIWLLSIIAVLSLIGTLIPQNEEAGFYVERFGQGGQDILLQTGLSNIYSSWWFLLCLVLFSLNLAVCLLNRFSLKIQRLGLTITHLSVLVILAGALIGMLFGRKGYFQISEGEEVRSFVANNGQKIEPGFSIRLNDFIYSEHIDPKEKLLVCSAQKEGVCDLHGPGVAEKNPDVIAQVSTEVGTEAKIGVTGYTIKILRYLPDFVMDVATKAAMSRSSVPKNPAIEVELKDKDNKVKKIWVFAAYPDAHAAGSTDFKFVYNWMGRRPKDFVSKVTILKDGKEVVSQDIRVNAPLRFEGYSFFQSSYDQDKLSWSGLQVNKDPGVPVVYSGFVLLILGLMAIFYVNPLIRR
jgi:hypothetical protein